MRRARKSDFLRAIGHRTGSKMGFSSDSASEQPEPKNAVSSTSISEWRTVSGVASSEFGSASQPTLHTPVTLRNRAPITAIRVEFVKIEIQKLNNSEISEVKYQSGMLLGYEVRVSFITARKTIARQKSSVIS